MSNVIDTIIDSGQSYAYATLSRHGDYGHMHIKIRLPAANSWNRGNASLKITCQIGSNESCAHTLKPYAIKYGFHNSDECASLADLETFAKVMRKIERYLAKIESELGAPEGYADYAQRILAGSGCSVLISEPNDGWINGGPMREKEMVSVGPSSAKKLKKMEAALITEFARIARIVA